MDWFGPDFQYHYSPEYNWDYGLNGIFLQRQIPSVDDPRPDPWLLKLKIKDLMDGSDVQTTYVLHPHHCFDEWEQTDAYYVYKPTSLQYWGAIECEPGGTVTLSHIVKAIDTHTTSISISPQFDLPFHFPWVKMPLAMQFGMSATHTFEMGVGATSTFHVPPDAHSATFYTIWKYWLEEGYGNKYDLGGSVQKHAYATETNKDNDVCELKVEFYDEHGGDLGLPGWPD